MLLLRVVVCSVYMKTGNKFSTYLQVSENSEHIPSAQRIASGGICDPSPPPGVAGAMPPLPRLLCRHLSHPLVRRHTPFHPWPPAAQVLLRRELASSSAAAAAVVAGREKSSRRTLGYLLGVAAAMVGASYAAVPLYRRFCQATGLDGTVQRREVCPLPCYHSLDLLITWGLCRCPVTAHLRDHY